MDKANQIKQGRQQQPNQKVSVCPVESIAPQLLPSKDLASYCKYWSGRQRQKQYLASFSQQSPEVRKEIIKKFKAAKSISIEEPGPHCVWYEIMIENMSHYQAQLRQPESMTKSFTPSLKPFIPQQKKPELKKEVSIIKSKSGFLNTIKSLFRRSFYKEQEKQNSTQQPLLKEEIQNVQN